MKRLTFDGLFCDIAKCDSTPGGTFCETGTCALRRVWERLKEYEDTGLEPEDVRRLMQDWTSLIMTLDELGGMPHLRELVQAERDGRLVLLPCGTDVELERDGNTFKADNWNHTLTAFRDAPETNSGKKVALFSIVEAEAALAQKGDSDGKENT